MKLRLLMAVLTLTSAFPASADDTDLVIALCGSNSREERQAMYAPIIKSDPGRAVDILTELRRSVIDEEACWAAKADLVSNEIMSYLNSLD